MTSKSLRAGRRIGIMAASAVVGIVGFGPLAGHAFAATPSHSAILHSANETAQPPSNGWQNNGLRVTINAPGIGVTAAVPLCNPSNGWQC